MLTAAIVRGCKGAAASILLLLMSETMGGNQTWIERYTGYTDKPVSQALDYLVEQGLVTRIGERGEYTYRLAGPEQQLPLMSEQLPEKIESETFRLDHLVVSSSLTSSSTESETNYQLDRSSESEIFRVAAALDEYGIFEPKRSQILALPGISERLVRYHCETAREIPLAIYRILHKFKAPANWRPEQKKAVQAELTADLPEDDAEALEPVSEALKEAWAQACAELKCEIARAEYATWLLPAHPVGVDPGGGLVIGTGNAFGAAWLEQHVKRRLSDRLGLDVSIRITGV